MIERIITAFAVAPFENMVDLRDRTNSTVGAAASRDRRGPKLLKSMSMFVGRCDGHQASDAAVTAQR